MVAQRTADANGDGSVDDADYQVWRRNFGRTSGIQVQQSDSQNVSGAFAESVAPPRESRLPALEGETAARDEAFSTLAPSRGFGHERRSRYTPFGRKVTAQLKPPNDKDLLALNLEENLRLSRDFLRGWLPRSMPVGDDGDRDTQERSFDEAFGTAGTGSSTLKITLRHSL
jgi:hypothetical protein